MSKLQTLMKNSININSSNSANIWLGGITLVYEKNIITII